MVVVISFLPVFVPVLGREIRRDPVGLRVRVLYVGDAIEMAWDPTSGYLRSDPMIDLTPVPAHSRSDYPVDAVRRAVRIYIPRTYSDLNRTTDLALFSDADSRYIESRAMSWVKRGVLEDGLGLIMVGGSDTFGAEFSFDADWLGTPVEDVLPVKCVDGSHPWGIYRLSVDAQDHPLTNAFDLEKAPAFMGVNEVILRDGASLLAHTVPYAGTMMITGATELPSLAYWDVERGRSLGLMHDWNGATGAYFKDWEYYPDFCSAMVIYTVGLEIPDDMVLVHSVRELLYQYRIRKAMCLGVLEFVEKLGGNVRRLSEKLGEAEEVHQKGRRLFLYQDYSASSEGLHQALGILQEAENLGVQLKSGALFWVYLTEWLVVTATFVLSATLGWSLMVKRKLYREIPTTRTELK